MKGFVPRVLAIFGVITCVSNAASAAPVQIGLFSFDADTPTGSSFSITNLTGANWLPPEYPIETLLTFTITNLTATIRNLTDPTMEESLSIAGSAFTADSSGNVNCTAEGDAGTGDCNFAAYDVLSAVVTGTLTSTTALIGLPAGYVGVESTFTATLTPGCDTVLVAGCDVAIIEATLVEDRPVGVPEPSTALLLQLGMGLLVSSRINRRSPLLQRLSARRQ